LSSLGGRNWASWEKVPTIFLKINYLGEDLRKARNQVGRLVKKEGGKEFFPLGDYFWNQTLGGGIGFRNWNWDLKRTKLGCGRNHFL